MVRLVQSPRKRRPSLSSSESSSSTASSRIVVRRPGERAASMALSTRSISTSTIGKARLVDILPWNLEKPRRSTRMSVVAKEIGDMDGDEERPGSRSISGETLVAKPSVGSMKEPVKELLEEGIKVLDMDWSVEKLHSPAALQKKQVEDRQGRRSSRLSMLTSAMATTASSLGKRSREVFEQGKEKLQVINQNKRTNLRPRLSEPLTVQKQEQEQKEEPPLKKTRVSVRSAPNLVTITETSVVTKQKSKKLTKRWLGSGLYVGQQRWFNPKFNSVRNRKAVEKRISAGAQLQAERQFLPMPMFVGESMVNAGRDFRLPFDVFSPLPPGQPRPHDWKKTSTNLFIGEAATEWKLFKPIGHARCMCIPETGCDDDCHNRYMFYECDDNNCNIGAALCKNRSFAELKERCKSGNRYDIGVELMKTGDRGFGVRACRTFEPNQIIVEYAGEIITKEECERRMKEEYQDNECYYLMAFDQRMMIDATRGSIARFANHSCEPNCRMTKWTVAGKPRMALFAGDYGVMTGEELTYDYNFDPYSTKNVQVCRCGTPSCRGFLGPRPPQLKGREREREREKQQTDKPRGKSTDTAISDTVTGANQKLQSVLNNSKPQSAVTGASSIAKRKSTLPPDTNNKRRRATTGSTAILNSQGAEPTKPSRLPSSRISSSASTLVEKENLSPFRKAGMNGTSSTNASRTSSAETKYRVTKRSSPAHKQQDVKQQQQQQQQAVSNTASALSRMASVLKRNASTLKRKMSTRQSRKSASAAGTFPTDENKDADAETALVPLLDSNIDNNHMEPMGHNHIDEKPKGKSMFSGLKRNTSIKSTSASTTTNTTRPGSVSSALSAFTKPGVVRSVRGERRAEAMRKMGLGGSGNGKGKGKVGAVKLGKSVRIVEE